MHGTMAQRGAGQAAGPAFTSLKALLGAAARRRPLSRGRAAALRVAVATIAAHTRAKACRDGGGLCRRGATAGLLMGFSLHLSLHCVERGAFRARHPAVEGR